VAGLIGLIGLKNGSEALSDPVRDSVGSQNETELRLQELTDRVTRLEQAVERLGEVQRGT